jgi:hypothetical protein
MRGGGISNRAKKLMTAIDASHLDAYLKLTCFNELSILFLYIFPT